MSDTTTEGTFLAVLKNGQHVTYSSYYFRFESFKADVAAHLRGRAVDVIRFYYAFGTESQAYTPGEVLEVFFGE